MELTLERIRELAVKTAGYEWYKDVQQTDEFWESSLTVAEGFDVVVEVLEYIQDQIGGKPLGMDLGAADGVVVLLMHYCGIQAYGIEKVEERLRVARQSCEDLGLGDDIGLGLGDWMEDAPYRALGIAVGEVDFFIFIPRRGGPSGLWRWWRRRLRKGGGWRLI